MVWEESQGSDGQASGGLKSHGGREGPGHLVGQPNRGPAPMASVHRHHTRVSPGRPAHPGRDSRLQMSGVQGLRIPQPQSRLPTQPPPSRRKPGTVLPPAPQNEARLAEPPRRKQRSLWSPWGESIGGAALAGDPRPCCGFSPSAPGVGLAPGPRAETRSCLEQRESCLYEAEQDRHILKAAVKQDLAL